MFPPTPFPTKVPVAELYPQAGSLPSKRGGYKVTMHTFLLPEKVAWVIKRKIGRSTKIVCKGGPYKEWYSSIAARCRLRHGQYEVICKDLRSSHGWGGGYLTIGPHKICKQFTFDKGKWAKAKILIGKHYTTDEPQNDYPWLMRLRLKHEGRKVGAARAKSRRKAMVDAVEGAASVMERLAHAATGSASGTGADPIGAKALMAQAKMAEAKAKVQHDAEAKVATQELMTKLTKAIANHSQSHSGKCPSQLSLLGATAEISDGVGCRLEDKGRPLCKCPSWPFKVCTGRHLQSPQAGPTNEVIQRLGHCRLAVWPLILLILSMLLPLGVWVVWVRKL